MSGLDGAVKRKLCHRRVGQLDAKQLVGIVFICRQMCCPTHPDCRLYAMRVVGAATRLE